MMRPRSMIVRLALAGPVVLLVLAVLNRREAVRLHAASGRLMKEATAVRQEVEALIVGFEGGRSLSELRAHDPRF